MALNFNDIPNDIKQVIFNHNRNQAVINKSKRGMNNVIGTLNKLNKLRTPSSKFEMWVNDDDFENNQGALNIILNMELLMY